MQEPGPALENIGNGYARLCLKRLDANGITPEQAAEWFVLSAAPAGDKTGFENALRMLADDKRTDALLPGMSGYIARYIEAGCPAVHHSETYRRAYSPAYRVVKTELCRGLIQPK
ncbi:MAG: hypothetical protein J5772_05030 [Clostridia bacterium]|nr:hypothetical protein [Clostridia bacterium]